MADWDLMGKDQYLLSSLDNALQLIDLLSEKEDLGLAEITKSLNMSKASVFRMLYTLEKRAFVKKSDDAKYDLGMKFVRYGTIVTERQNIVQKSRPYMQKLRDTFNETAHLAIITQSGKMVFIYKEYSASSIQMTARVGTEKEAYCTATGKVLLAYLPSGEQESIAHAYDYQQYTPNTIMSPESLLEELARIREQGYSVDNEESEVGLTCLSAPILDYRGQCVAALSLSGPTARMVDRKAELVAALKDAAGKILAD